MNKLTRTEDQVALTLRIAVACCFIGHGVFGVITKEIWCNYFGVFGIGRETSYALMPVVGIADILMGIWMLVYPVRFVPAWLIFWGLLTALLRPLSGEPFAEFLERAGNYGAPLALLVLVGFPQHLRGFFRKMAVPGNGSPAQLQRTRQVLQVVVFLLLLGHGWLNLIEKKGLLDQYASLGLPAVAMARWVGLLEVLAALLVLVKPIRPLLLLFFGWKMLSEMFYPNYGLFEWIERGGSYGAILALWLLSGNPLSTGRGWWGNKKLAGA